MARQWARRGVLSGMAAVLAGTAAAQEPRERQPGQETPPILFVHGSGDSAAIWVPTIWRFESNYHSRSRLFAADMRLPVARQVDAVREPGRTSAEEATAQLTQEIARVRRATGIERLVVITHGRSGNILRNYLRLNPRQRLKAAILCAPPSHGVIISDRHMVGSELNGASPFLRQLNALPGGVPPETPVFTLASDRMDKWAQPDGRFLGLPGVETGITATSAALRGATNIVVPGADHIETACSPEAFAEIWRIVAGELPPTLRIRPEVRPSLNGKVTGYEAGAPTNIGLAGARVRIFPVDPATGQRTGPEQHSRITTADGTWGPFDANPETTYEFELTARGHPVTHIYRAPFPRGSDYVHLRPWLPSANDPTEGSLLIVSRPRGFFDIGRDQIEIGNQVVQGEADIPHESILRATGPATPQSIPVLYNGERITARTWPIAERRVAVVELSE